MKFSFIIIFLFTFLSVEALSQQIGKSFPEGDSLNVFKPSFLETKDAFAITTYRNTLNGVQVFFTRKDYSQTSIVRLKTNEFIGISAIFSQNESLNASFTGFCTGYNSTDSIYLLTQFEIIDNAPVFSIIDTLEYPFFIQDSKTHKNLNRTTILLHYWNLPQSENKYITVDDDLHIIDKFSSVESNPSIHESFDIENSGYTTALFRNYVIYIDTSTNGIDTIINLLSPYSSVSLDHIVKINESYYVYGVIDTNRNSIQSPKNDFDVALYKISQGTPSIQKLFFNNKDTLNPGNFILDRNDAGNGSCLAESIDGNLYVVGTKNYDRGGGLGAFYDESASQIMVSKVDTNLNVLWKHLYKDTAEARYTTMGVYALKDGGAMVVSYRYDWKYHPEQQQTLHLFRIKPDGLPYELGTMELLGETSLSIFPNPTSNFISVSNINLTEVSRMYIIDIQGREFELEIQLDHNLNRFNSGLYFLVIAKTNGQVLVMKVVKQ